MSLTGQPGMRRVHRPQRRLAPIGRRERSHLAKGRRDIHGRLDLHGMTQERAATPSISTVQAPHSPSPQPYFGGKTITDQAIKKSDLQAAAGVIAKLEAFEFDLKFDVVEYTVSATVTGSYAEDIVKGAAVSGKAKEIFGKLKTGQKVYIENVKVKAPDGTIRTIGNLAFKVI